MSDLAQLAPCGCFSFGSDRLLIEVNEIFGKLLVCNPGAAAGEPLEKFLTLPSKIFCQTHFFPLLQMQGNVEEVFMTLLSTNQQPLPVLINARKHDTPNGVVYACAFIVVRNRKKFEDELVAAKHKAQHALAENAELQRVRDELVQQSAQLDKQLDLVIKQNDDLTQFNRVVTHELQEPVRKISMFSHLLIQKQGSEDDILPRLLRSTDQMRKIVSGLQSYLWLQDAETNRALIDLKMILLSTTQRLQKEFGPDTIDLQITDLPLVYADASQIKALCYEILSNSIKFRKPGQAARVEVGGTAIRKNSYKALAEKYAYAEYIKLHFTDTGKGFESKFNTQVFGLFYRLEENEGKGMGLAICKKIVHNHGGTIGIDASPGNGATVSIVLPANHSGAGTISNK